MRWLRRLLAGGLAREAEDFADGLGSHAIEQLAGPARDMVWRRRVWVAAVAARKAAEWRRRAQLLEEQKPRRWEAKHRRAERRWRRWESKAYACETVGGCDAAELAEAMGLERNGGKANDG